MDTDTIGWRVLAIALVLYCSMLFLVMSRKLLHPVSGQLHRKLGIMVSRFQYGMITSG